MKRQLIGVLAGLVTATALVTAQGSQTPQDPKKDMDVTLTGCLIQGSGPDVFVLDRARLDPQSRAEKTKTYVVVAATEDLAFATKLNHEVTVTGSADPKVAPMPDPGKKVDEKDLPRLHAKSVTAIADTCTAERH